VHLAVGARACFPSFIRTTTSHHSIDAWLSAVALLADALNQAATISLRRPSWWKARLGDRQQNSTS